RAFGEREAGSEPRMYYIPPNSPLATKCQPYGSRERGDPHVLHSAKFPARDEMRSLRFGQRRFGLHQPAAAARSNGRTRGTHWNGDSAISWGAAAAVFACLRPLCALQQTLPSQFHGFDQAGQRAACTPPCDLLFLSKDRRGWDERSATRRART